MGIPYREDGDIDVYYQRRNEMLDIDKIPAPMLKVFRNECDYTDDEIASWNAVTALDNWLEWEGIIGYTDIIVRHLDALRRAEDKGQLNFNADTEVTRIE